YPVTPALAERSMATATRSVLGNPRRIEVAIARNNALRRRTAPPTARRALVYLPRPTTGYRRPRAYRRPGY
ncbi:MAG TPA: hypothetical protein VEJ84_03310, partial [Acidimicrobiales bacterium]|nr:hypothetical protein [Acidimicrobiales bacterium]